MIQYDLRNRLFFILYIEKKQLYTVNKNDIIFILLYFFRHTILTYTFPLQRNLLFSLVHLKRSSHAMPRASLETFFDPVDIEHAAEFAQNRQDAHVAPSTKYKYNRVE